MGRTPYLRQEGRLHVCTTCASPFVSFFLCYLGGSHMKPSIIAVVAAFAVLVGCATTDSTTSPVSALMNAQARSSHPSFATALAQVATAPRVAVSDDAESPALSPADARAAGYCKQTGGEVFVRQPEYDTNSSNPLVLAGRAPFCQYTAVTTYGSSRIHILLHTLYTRKPSLAALAYIIAPYPESCNGNPASCYCSQLGASDQFGGDTGAGGSWVNAKSPDVDLEACIFPDRSSIDSWGLAYHAYGIIRGIDLTTVMRYKYTGNRIHS